MGNFWSFFAQDNFRVTPNLTFNVGFRWEINPFYYGIRGQKAGFDVSNGKVIIPSDLRSHRAAALSHSAAANSATASKPPVRWACRNTIQPTSGGPAPRIGFAWRPFGSTKWAIRSAYGIFWVFPDDNLINNTDGTVPFIASQTVINDPAGQPRPAAPSAISFSASRSRVAEPRQAQVCSFGFAAASCSTPNVYGGELAHERHLCAAVELLRAAAIDGAPPRSTSLMWATNPPI